MPDEAAVVAAVRGFVERELKGREAEAPVFGRLRFQLPAHGMRLSQVLRAMEARKNELNVSAYALSQPTLEQVTIAFHACYIRSIACIVCLDGQLDGRLPLDALPYDSLASACCVWGLKLTGSQF